MRYSVDLVLRANRAETQDAVLQLIFEAADKIEQLEGELEVSRQQTQHMMRQLCAYPPLSSSEPKVSGS